MGRCGGKVVLSSSEITDLENVLSQVVTDGIHIILACGFTNVVVIEYCLRHGIRFNVHVILIENRANNRTKRYIMRLKSKLANNQLCESFNIYTITCNIDDAEQARLNCPILSTMRDIIYGTDGCFIEFHTLTSLDKLPDELVFEDKMIYVLVPMDKVKSFTNFVRYVRWWLSPPVTVTQCVKPLCSHHKQRIDNGELDEWFIRVSGDYQF